MYNLFNNISVIEDGDYITINGINFRDLELDFYRLYKTSKIIDYMVIRVNYTKIKFLSFFAVEVAFLLVKILEGKRMASNKRSIDKIKNLLIKNTWLNKIDSDNVKEPLDLSKLKDLDLEPLDFQMNFFNDYNRVVPRYNLLGMLLAGAPGSGKTYTSLAVAHCAGALKTVIVCPLNAVDRVWVSNIALRHSAKGRVWCSTSDTPIDSACDFFIIHYEYLEKALNNYRALLSDKTALILDESHYLNEVTSLRTNLFLELASKLKPIAIVEASGTPIKAFGSESIPLLRAIDPLFTEKVEKSFKLLFGVNATRTLELLNNRLGLVSFKVLKEELNLEKPVSSIINIQTPDSEKYTLESITKDVRVFITQRIAYYKSVEKDYVNTYLNIVKKASKVNSKLTSEFNYYSKDALEIRNTFSKGFTERMKELMKSCTKFENTYIISVLSDPEKKIFRDVRSAYKYVNLKIQGEALGRVIGRARIDCHLSMAKHINYKEICFSTTKKTLIFTSFVEVLESVMDILTKSEEFSPLAVYGKTNNDLDKIVTNFDIDDNLNPLVATYKSLSSAVPLTMADTVILIDAPFRTYILEQAISRVHRLGADTVVRVYSALLDTGAVPNISTRASDILEWSQEQIKLIMGIDAPFKLETNEEDLNISVESLNEQSISSMVVNKSMQRATEDYGIEFTDELFKLESKPIASYW